MDILNIKTITLYILFRVSYISIHNISGNHYGNISYIEHYTNYIIIHINIFKKTHDLT